MQIHSEVIRFKTLEGRMQTKGQSRHLDKNRHLDKDPKQESLTTQRRAMFLTCCVNMGTNQGKKKIIKVCKVVQSSGECDPQWKV